MNDTTPQQQTEFVLRRLSESLQFGGREVSPYLWLAVLIPVLASVPMGIARGPLDTGFAVVRDGRDARRGQLRDDPGGMAELAQAGTDLPAAGAAVARHRGGAS